MQRRFTKQCWLLLSLLSIACARPQHFAPMESVHNRESGPYPIVNCGTDTAAVSILVNTLIMTLQPVLKDASKDQPSDAYTTFFKNIGLASTVFDTLLKVTTGPPISPGPHANRGAPPELFGSPIIPQIVCITDYKQVTWSRERGGIGGAQDDAYTKCQESPVSALGVFGSKYLKNSIILCPHFWSHAAIPLRSKSACSVSDPHFNRFRDSGRRMIDYQLWIIMSELVHAYIYARSGSLTEIENVNDCISLAGGSAVNTARNYIFYAAMIRLGCTSFPRDRRHQYSDTIPIHPGSVELLEIDANTTLSGGAEQRNISTTSTGLSTNDTSSGTFADLSNGIALAPWWT